MNQSWARTAKVQFLNVVKKAQIRVHHLYTLLKIFKRSDFQSHTFGNILGKILPDCSPV